MNEPASIARTTALPDWATVPALLVAWDTVRHGGRSAGIDGISMPMFARDAERRIESLSARLRSATYRPSAYIRVLRPKPTGGFRAIALPTVDDRIAQLALARAVGAVVEGTYSTASYAYRPNLGPRRAAEHLLRLVKPDSWAVVTDIEAFFDNVDHDILLRLLREAGLDTPVLRLFRDWLTAPVIDRGYRLQPMKGVPQGSPASPMLANLYLTAFDREIEERGWRHVRYADDFVVVADCERQAAEIVAYLTDWLWRERKLRLKHEKTAFVAAHDGIGFVGFHIVPSGCTIPAARITAVKDRIAVLLAEPNADSMADVVRSHNALARGWRNYYGRISPAADGQLRELDRWRRNPVAAYARALDVAPGVARAVFERFEPEPPRRSALLDEYGDYPSPPTPSDIAEVADDPGHAARPPFARSESAFLAPGELTNHVTERSAPATLLEDGTLTVPSHGAYLARLGGLLALRRKKSTLFACAEDEVRHVVLAGPGTLISTSALLALAERGTPVTVCEHSGRPLARMVAPHGERRARLIEEQVAARNDERGVRIAKAFVYAKIRNQRALLLYEAKYAGRSAAIRDQLASAATVLRKALYECRRITADSIESARKTLFLLEARAAKRYWHALAGLVPADWSFPGRRGRGARDPLNAMLNYGYWRLSMAVWRAIEGEELHPFLGFLHTSRHGGAGLVYDAMEEFRPVVVDRTVLAMIGRGASVVLRSDGRLATATRRRVDRALARSAQRPLRRGRDASLGDALRRQVGRLRLAITEGRAYRGFAMPW